ncbi:myristoylated alanine-rich C-kinase substrate-like [Daphnia pulex]|uniref:myristoylated alanine-rich C-kinase substrate-like n=1 Tax=Daphnia pulex TaxID=6669 RepID=UPI001EE021ED|nr:myristoylated alanine-rich C-kinase substrate-like [Daphnia pulex]
MKLSLLTLLLVAAVVCISVTDSAPSWPRFRARRLRNRTEAPAEEIVEAAPEGKKEEKAEAAPEEAKKEEKTEAAIDFGTLPVETAAEEAPKEKKVEEAAPVKQEEAKPKKAAKVEEAEEAEEAEGLSAEV